MLFICVIVGFLERNLVGLRYKFFGGCGKMMWMRYQVCTAC